MRELPAGFSERLPVPDDAIVVADLMAAYVQADGGAEGTSVEHVLDDWHEVDLREEAVLVLAPDGTAAGYVHPDYRGRGIGSCLVGWGERWIEERIRLAPQGARVVVKHYVISTNSGARRLLDNKGYEAVRGTYVMEIDLE